MTRTVDLYPVDGSGRNFDTHTGPVRITGRLAIVTGFEDGPRTVVYYDRKQPLEGVHATKSGGSLGEIADDARAKELITAAIETTNQ